MCCLEKKNVGIDISPVWALFGPSHRNSRTPAHHAQQASAPLELFRHIFARFACPAYRVQSGRSHVSASRSRSWSGNCGPTSPPYTSERDRKRTDRKGKKSELKLHTRVRKHLTHTLLITAFYRTNTEKTYREWPCLIDFFFFFLWVTQLITVMEERKIGDGLYYAPSLFPRTTFLYRLYLSSKQRYLGYKNRPLFFSFIK